MANYWEIGKENLRHNLLIHAGIALLLLCFSPLVLGVKNLGLSETAKVLEIYVALIGIVLITPVFLPEQNRDLRDLIHSKYTKVASIYSIRVIESILVLMLFLGIYLWFLHRNGCEMDAAMYFAGTLAEMLFLGGLGIISYSLTDNLVAGYMIPIFYYITAIGGGKKFLKSFYPFSMSQGSYSEKYWLLAAGIVLIILGIRIRSRK
ncbi:hypothetical protein HGO97_013360 [Faecalicatena sp. AGMB00832]|uniref:ABC transporter permease n=1 Tax=Faecalicatena faecalis TaxID=2726362 RepID=A0ABS6D5M8_9FIRM|nr:hypothetical protein [Faecalicatena faecalis]